MIYTIIGIILLFVVGKILSFPLKFIMKLIVNAIVGYIILLCANVLLSIWDIELIITPLRSFICGLIGVPYVIILLLLRWFGYE